MSCDSCGSEECTYPNARIEEIHISLIRAGDTVLHDGVIKTVSPRCITRDSFLGRRLWGDCYRLGTIPVKRVSFLCDRSRRSA